MSNNDDRLSRVNIIDGIKNGDYNKIVFMCGAGISVAAGIPDFRSPGTGLYDNLQKYNLPRPEAVFELNYFKKSPEAFYTLSKELFPRKVYHPTLAHFFMKLVKDKGLLVQVYTQNVDCLEFEAGLTDDDVVCAHGSFRTARVLETGEPVDIDIVREAISKGEVCYHNGKLVKPDIVFFGEGLPKRFHEFKKDFDRANLLIVMGTSLAVYPFASLVEATDDDVPRVLVNREAVGPFTSPGPRDINLLGDLEGQIIALAESLGWKEDLMTLRDTYTNPLKTTVPSSSTLETPGPTAVSSASAPAPTPQTDIPSPASADSAHAPKPEAPKPDAPKPPNPAKLRRAIMMGDTAGLRQLIREGGNVNARLPGGVSGSKVNGRTVTGSAIDISLLDIAVDERQMEILEILLEEGADPRNADVEGGDALQLAAQKGYLEGINLLLRYGANANSTDNLGGTALIRAAENGCPKCVRALLEAGANANSRGHTVGGTPLYWAALSNSPETVKLLLDAGADPNIADNAGRLAGDIARDLGFEEVVNLLKDHQLPVLSAEDAMYLCVEKGDVASLLVLIKEGSDVNARVRGKLNGDEQLGEYSFLEYAIDRKNVTMLNVLIENGANINSADTQGRTPLIFATQRNASEMVRALLVHKPDVNTRDIPGSTALGYAKDEGILQQLLAAGASGN